LPTFFKNKKRLENKKRKKRDQNLKKNVFYIYASICQEYDSTRGQDSVSLRGVPLISAESRYGEGVAGGGGGRGRG